MLQQGSSTILLADSIGGLVLGLDTRTGLYDVVLENALMKPPSASSLGINGLHTRDDFLYFTNSDQGFLGRVRIHLTNGTAAGPYEVVANIHSFCDDFALGPGNAAYIATDPNNTIVKVQTVGEYAGSAMIIEGNLNSTAFAGATAAAFGRTSHDHSILYVTTNGGLRAPVNGSFVQGGKLSAIKLDL